MSSFIWYELMTSDPDAASAFYGAVIGWKVPPPAPGGQDYRMLVRGDGGNAGGMMKILPDMAAAGCRPAWMPYLHVADVAAAAAAIGAAGGQVLVPPTRIPQGTFAMLNDPQGVPIYIMDPVPPPGMEDYRSDVFARDGAAQRVAWNELASPDLAGSKAFYAGQFGFEFNETMNMGEMGDYCFIDQDGERQGAMMQRADERQPAMWLPYFRVGVLEPARAAIEAGGGTVLMGPHEVPGGEWIVVAMDPQGAGFGLVAKQKD